MGFFFIRDPGENLFVLRIRASVRGALIQIERLGFDGHGQADNVSGRFPVRLKPIDILLCGQTAFDSLPGGSFFKFLPAVRTSGELDIFRKNRNLTILPE